MRFGNLSGLVNGTESVVYDSGNIAVTSSTISTGNILDGDTDGAYKVIVLGVSSLTNTYAILRMNGDTGSNYGYRGIDALDTTLGQENGASSGIYITNRGTNSGKILFGAAKVLAKSGSVRRSISTGLSEISGTTTTNSFYGAGVWNNTADNLVSFQIFPSSAYFGVGTRVLVLKSNNFTNGTPTGTIQTPYVKGSWIRVGTSTLDNSTTQTVSFTGLDGDRDVIYYLTSRAKMSGGVVYSNTYITPQGIPDFLTDAQYGFQQIRAAGATLSGNRYSSGLFSLGSNYGAEPNKYQIIEMLLYAKTGQVRPFISSSINNISGAIVEAHELHGGTWVDTSTNITSLNFYCHQTTGTPRFASGSQFDLYALRPNG